MVGKNPLCSLANYMNVNGYKAVGRRVRAERSRLERVENRGEEWHMDVLTLRRFHRFPLGRPCVCTFLLGDYGGAGEHV